MIHDQSLVDHLSGLPVERFDGEVFRTTGVSADPLAFSVNGGRRAPPARDGVDVPILYTSLERDGALAEVVSYLTLLTPLPKSRPLKVARLAVSTSKTLRLARTDLEAPRVDLTKFGERDYAPTQRIGAAIAFLGLDGLIAPSARWRCDNLMIFQTNHLLTERLEILEDEIVNWAPWARANGFLGPGARKPSPTAARTAARCRRA